MQVFFATLPIAVKLALRDLSSPALAFFRVSAAALLFLLLQRVLVNERVRSWADYGRLALYGFFGVTLNQLLYITALTMTTATAAQTIITAMPAMALLVAIVLGRERATGAKWFGIALAGTGALYLVGADLSSGSGHGNLLVLLNVAAFSIYLVLSRDLLRSYNALTVVTWVFVFGMIGLAPWGMPAAIAELGAVTQHTFALLAYIVLIPTVGVYYLNSWTLKHMEASVVALYAYLQPVFTALLAVPLLGEHIPPRLLPAAALIFAGVGATVWAERRAKRRAARALVVTPDEPAPVG